MSKTDNISGNCIVFGIWLAGVIIFIKSGLTYNDPTYAYILMIAQMIIYPLMPLVLIMLLAIRNKSKPAFNKVAALIGLIYTVYNAFVLNVFYDMVLNHDNYYQEHYKGIYIMIWIYGMCAHIGTIYCICILCFLTCAVSTSNSAEGFSQV
jgi:hypothetical protein